MKLSLVLTLGTLCAGLLVASGCLRSPLTTSPHSAQIASDPVAGVALATNDPVVETEIPAAGARQAQTTSRSSEIRVSEPPPMPQVEVIGAPPGKDFTWIPGRWKWEGGWTWVSGSWVAMPSPNASWVPGRWVRRGDAWVWVAGQWRMASLQ